MDRKTIHSWNSHDVVLTYDSLNGEIIFNAESDDSQIFLEAFHTDLSKRREMQHEFLNELITMFTELRDTWSENCWDAPYESEKAA